MRLTRISLLLLILLLVTPALRAEYVVLRNGLRLRVTGYQLLDDKYHLQMKDGFVEVPATDVVTIEPEDTFAPEPSKPVVAPPYRELVEAAAARHGVDADLITSVIAVESNFDPKAVSRKNARGLMQLLPETAARFGVKNIEDPQENIDAGTQYLRELLQKYNNNLALTLAAYNAGPERVQQYGSVPPFAETISYVRRVKRGYEKSKAESSKKKEETKTPVASPTGSIAPPATKTPTTPGAANSPAPSGTLNNQLQ
ncbi:MAG TPA: lytic transglycosylase domain-containing protein [Candidatus Acidoferrum sp.]|nr:lytic transglycosylase domain-containing protein [Candidatus Acidoferrum sp.]